MAEKEAHGIPPTTLQSEGPLHIIHMMYLRQTVAACCCRSNVGITTAPQSSFIIHIIFLDLGRLVNLTNVVGVILLAASDGLKPKSQATESAA